MSSSNHSGPRVKHCPRISLPNAATQAPPPPRSDLPVTIDDIPMSTVTLKSDSLPSIDDIPTSTVTLKSSPLPPPPPRVAPPKKKRVPNHPSPFFDGVYGRPLFSLAPVRHFSAIPDGKSIIFHFFRKALPHELAECGSPYILIDVYENLWVAPEVFLKWREAVDSRAAKDIEKSAVRLCLTRISDEFRLYSSPQKDSLQSVKHPVPPPFSHLPMASDNKDDDEDEAFPAGDEESDPDFLPDKK